jgi:Zinc-binding dehydrogenase
MLYDNSPAYLKPGGPFINVGVMEGAVTSLWATAKNYFWPQFLGGTPRKYMFQQTNPTQERLKYLVQLVEDGKLKVIIDQVYDMQDGLKVRAIGATFPLDAKSPTGIRAYPQPESKRQSSGKGTRRVMSIKNMPLFKSARNQCSGQGQHAVLRCMQVVSNLPFGCNPPSNCMLPKYRTTIG